MTDTVTEDLFNSECADSNYADLTSKQDGGVLKKIIKNGSGMDSPMYGDKVFVDFIGILAENGKIFDSSKEKGKTFDFHFDKGEVIPAWDMCIGTMKRGEICKLVCKNNYAYGDIGCPPLVPPDATLVFEIELHDWCGEDLSLMKDGGIVRKVLKRGVGSETPNDGAQVTVSFIGTMNGKSFDERKAFLFTLGEGADHNIPYGIETALEHFKKNEISCIKLRPKYAYGSDGKLAFDIVTDTDVEYKVQLHEFQKARESWQLDTIQRIECAKMYKEKGSSFYKQEKYKIAAKQYEKILSFLQFAESSLGELKREEFFNLLLSGRLNLAMCYLKLKDYVPAQDHAFEAMKLDPKNIKACFRLGQALLNLGKIEEALKNFEKCLEFEENNKAVSHHIDLCHEATKQHKHREKELYGGMFEKFAKSDARKLAAILNSKDVMDGDLGQWEGEQKLEVIDTTQDELKAVQMIYI